MGQRKLFVEPRPTIKELIRGVELEKEFRKVQRQNPDASFLTLIHRTIDVATPDKNRAIDDSILLAYILGNNNA